MVVAASVRRGGGKCRSRACVLPQSQRHVLVPPTFTHAWITAENVNDVTSDSGITGEVDRLALDIDGVAYWVWEAITCIRPRVVVCETHGVIGADDPLTIPYDPNFVITTPDYHSASLAAMTKLADQKATAWLEHTDMDSTRFSS